jgi:hypothetical protein
MKTLSKLLQELSDLTVEIETHYPELYRHLDETPLFFTESSGGKIGKEELKSYLDTLKQELITFMKTHKSKV